MYLARRLHHWEPTIFVSDSDYLKLPSDEYYGEFIENIEQLIKERCRPRTVDAETREKILNVRYFRQKD